MCDQTNLPMQFHHIDNDPSNNAIDNIVYVCANCHAKIHTTSDMSSNYSETNIKFLRSKLYECVENKRKEVEKIKKQMIIDPNDSNRVEYLDEDFISGNPELCEIIMNMNRQYFKIRVKAQKYYDTRITSKINEGIMLEIAYLELIMNSLLKFYPKNHFYNEDNENIFERLHDDFYDFLYKLYAPDCIRFEGSIIHIYVPAGYMYFFKKIINILIKIVNITNILQSYKLSVHSSIQILLIYKKILHFVFLCIII